MAAMFGCSAMLWRFYGDVMAVFGDVMAVFGDVRRDYGGTWMTP